MFKPRTVFIVGAGASEEVGMPLGGALASAIARSFFFEFERFSYEPQSGADYQVLTHIKRLSKATGRDLNDYLSAARLFHEGIQLAGSIDEYLSRHADRPLHSALGKLAVLHMLIAAERKSLLFCDEHAKASRIVEAGEKSWLAEFARQLFVGRRASDLDRIFDDIAVISFNYDRCLQRYLIAAIQQAYHVPAERAQEVVARLDIVYPYGTLGSLFPSTRDYLSFGADVTSHDLTPRLDTIRTFAEHFDDSDRRTKIHMLVAQASALVFLGFGFHTQNIDLLRPSQSEGNRVIIVATGFGLSDPNIKSINRRLKGLRQGNLAPPVVDRNLTASGLISDYRMVLSA